MRLGRGGEDTPSDGNTPERGGGDLPSDINTLELERRGGDPPLDGSREHPSREDTRQSTQ
jgi:hypothetical protein